MPGIFAMHSISGGDARQRPYCAKEINALHTCHKEKSIAKFFGACNDHKILLDKCLKVEKMQRYEAALAKSGRGRLARVEKARLKKAQKEEKKKAEA